jgi:HlyD family secretion protein
MRNALFSIMGCLLLSSCTHHHTHALGYVEGRYVYLSSPVSGTLISLGVQKGQSIAKNQLAFQLDPQPELSQLQNAEAQLESAEQDLKDLELGQRTTVLDRLSAQIKQAEANVAYSKKMLDRNVELRKTHYVSQAALDQARSQFQSDSEALHTAEANLAEGKLGAREHAILSMRAKVKSLRAQVSQYQWMVSQKTIRIPSDGFVQDTLFRQNEFVPAGKPVVEFLPPANRLLIFFVPERNLSEVKMGQTIHFTCDACQKNMTASIDYISSHAEYTPPVIYSKDSREKLVYWVEAKIDPAVVNKMNPGQPIEVIL